MKKVWIVLDKETNSVIAGFDSEKEAKQYIEMNPFGRNGLYLASVDVFRNFLEYVGTPEEVIS